MLILLPPSEGKTGASSGSPLDLASIDFPSLTPVRRTVLNALVTICRKDPRSAARVLGLGPTQAAEVAVNAALKRAPAAPAISVYTGVLYEALDAATLTAPQRRRLNGSVAIASALFGLVRPDDAIPAYRLSGDTSLPALGPLSGVWRDAVTGALESTRGVILDLRSAAYVALGPLPAACAGRAVTGRVLLEREGRRSVVSHHNKATKGRLVRDLCIAGARPNSINALMASISELGYRIELHEGRRAEVAPTVDIIVREV